MDRITLDDSTINDYEQNPYGKQNKMRPNLKWTAKVKITFNTLECHSGYDSGRDTHSDKSFVFVQNAATHIDRDTPYAEIV